MCFHKLQIISILTQQIQTPESRSPEVLKHIRESERGFRTRVRPLTRLHQPLMGWGGRRLQTAALIHLIHLIHLIPVHFSLCPRPSSSAPLLPTESHEPALLMLLLLLLLLLSVCSQQETQFKHFLRLILEENILIIRADWSCDSWQKIN